MLITCTLAWCQKFQLDSLMRSIPDGVTCELAICLAFQVPPSIDFHVNLQQINDDSVLCITLLSSLSSCYCVMSMAVLEPFIQACMTKLVPNQPSHDMWYKLDEGNVLEIILVELKKNMNVE